MDIILSTIEHDSSERIINNFNNFVYDSALSYRLISFDIFKKFYNNILKDENCNLLYEKIFNKKLQSTSTYDIFTFGYIYNKLKHDYDISTSFELFKKYIDIKNKHKKEQLHDKYETMTQEHDLNVIIENIKNYNVGGSNLEIISKLKNIDSYSNIFSDDDDANTKIYKFYFNYVYEMTVYEYVSTFVYTKILGTNNYYDFEHMITNFLIEKNDVQYYSHKYDSNIIKPMRWFHNMIKRKLIDVVAKKFKNTKLLDVSGGQGGDIDKWNDSNINEVLFIEYDKQNIENPNDGAISRYKNLLKKGSNMKITFIHGDSTKNYIDGNAGLDFNNKLKLIKYFENNGKYNFNIVSCQFSIHYFFESKNTINSFIKNVSENLTPGGYFIGTALDGKILFDKLQTNQTLLGFKENTKIWEIIKLYESENFKHYGQKINAFNLNIGNYISENLVNFDYLIKICSNNGLSLCVLESFENTFKQLNPKGIGNGEKTYSFMHKYFIFKKDKNPEQLNIFDSNFIDLNRYTLKNVPILDKTNSCFANNIHVRQNIDAKYIKNFNLTLQNNTPTLKYKRSDPDEIRTNIHDGQRKLLMTEIYFLSKYHTKNNAVMIYAGAAPGTHITFLSSLFPNFTFVLVDPNQFTVKPTDNIIIHQRYFDNEFANILKKQYVGKQIYFCSDIRRANYQQMTQQRVEEIVKEDMNMQIEWSKILEPYVTMLKFRLPYDHYNRSSNKDIDVYPKGELLIQPWAPLTSTETRLIFLHENLEFVEYDNIKYQDQMFWHNRIGRVMCYDEHIQHDEHNGLDHCWDCTAEYHILQLYLKNIRNIDDPNEILKLSRYITTNVTKKQIKYPLVKEGRVQLNNSIHKKSYIKTHTE